MTAMMTVIPLVLVSGAAQSSTLPETFTYSGYSVINNTNVAIQAGFVNGTYGSGQIDLIGSGPNAGRILPTWCLDVFMDLQQGGTYSIFVPPQNNMGGDIRGQPLSGAALGQIAALVHYGDANLSQGGTTSSAVQLAIWSVEYAGLGYNFTSASPAVTAEAGSLLDQLSTGALAPLPASTLAWLIEVDPLSGYHLNQGLVTETPIPGALLLLGTALAAMGGVSWIVQHHRDHEAV